MNIPLSYYFYSILLTFVSSQSVVQDFSTISNVNLRNLLLVDNNVLVGSTSNLFRLDAENLNIQNTINLAGANRLLLPLTNTDVDGDVLSCQEQSCVLFDSNNLETKITVNIPSSNVAESLVPGSDDMVGVGGVNETFFIARDHLIEPGIESTISKFSYAPSDEELGLSLIGRHIESNRFFQRKFLTTFEDGSFVYFVYDLLIDGNPDLRVVRLCANETGGANSILTTYTEVTLSCNGVSSESEFASATLVTVGNNLMILVTQHFDSTNYICSYNVTDIDQAMDNKLEQCKDGIGNFNLQRNGGGTCPTGLTEAQQSGITPCARGGSLQQLLEVDDPVSGSSLLSYPSLQPFSSLASINYEGIVYVIAGTTGGIEQFYLNGDALLYIRPVNLTMTNDVVKEIHISKDEEFYYILSNTSVAKYPVNVCDQYSSCQSCVESLDPLCGWCTLSSSCTKFSDCTSSPQIWAISYSECPAINNIEPPFVYAYQLENDPSTSFNITYQSIPNITYNCVYQFEDMVSVASVLAEIVTNDTIRCPLPSVNLLPDFGDIDTLSANLSLRTMSLVDVVSGQLVQFTNCSTQSSCFSCLDSANKCYWCSESLKCYSDTDRCSASEVVIQGDVPTQSCPFVEPPVNNDNYLIHNLIDQELTIRAMNLQNFTPVCIIMDSTTLLNYTLPVSSQNSTHVVCDRTEFNVSLDITRPILEATLFISVNNVPIENPSNTKAVFYSCPLLGSNCGHCLSVDNKFNCVYCKNTDSCILSPDCPGTVLQGIDDVGQCADHMIDSFYPMAGPLQGNTTVVIEGLNLGADSSQVTDISIGSVKCNHIASEYLPGRSITCITDATTTAIFDHVIMITFTFNSMGMPSLLSSVQEFSFFIPKLADPPVFPSLGPLAGGTNVTIMGKNIGIGSTRSVTMAGKPCIINNEDQISDTAVEITCSTTSSNSTTVRGQGAIVLKIDGYTETALGFDYDNNPTFSSITPQFSILSGGTVLIVKGKDLDTVQRPLLLFYDSSESNVQKRAIDDNSFIYDNPIPAECFDNLDSEMKCYTPKLIGRNTTVGVGIGLKMDNVQDLLILNTTITVNLDPIFDNDNNYDIEPGQTQNLTIKGQHFLFPLDQMKITVEDVNIPCTPKLLDVNRSEVICEIEVSDDMDEGEYRINVQIGNYNKSIGSLTIDKPFDRLIIIISVFAVLVVIVAVIFIVSFSIFYRKYKQKDQQNDLLLFELDRLESSMAHECKLGFAELQTDVDELTGDLSGSRLPYHDFHVYLLQSLFPGAKDHPVLHELQLPPQKKIQTERALKDFHRLVLNKTVLMAIIQALEAQRAFTIRDKSNMGSLLMLALHDKLDYATDILKCLLSNLVRKTVADSYPKLLLRRTESVAEKMLSSWLAFTLHGYVMEHTGQPLYRLFKAVKAQLEKGPIDVVTGEARYSLSEQKLIRQQLSVTVINATVEAEDGLQIPVKLLDCDSISQAKEKMLDAVHKNAPVSQRPALTDIDIEFRTAPKEDGIILRDEDGRNDMESGWRKINTLSHYWIPDRAVFRLVTRHEKPAPGRVFDYTGSLMVTHGYRNRSISEAEDGWRVWHLFKQHEEDPRSSPFISKKMVTEIYLPRMLSTKTILQSFVDSLFSSIFTLSQPPISPSQLYTPINATFSPLSADQGYAPGTDSLPVPIKYLFDFLDDEAANAKITDTDVLHTWKNNSLALRFWVNMIKNPEFVFDINKSAIVDSCLSVIAQAFIDGCSSSDAKPTINSPTSKLLFNKEVQGYKTNVKRYYEQISELPRIPEEMMDTYLTDLSAHQAQLIEKSGNFHTESALNEIMRYCIKYKESISESLRSAGLDSEAQLLDSVIHRSM